MKTILCLCLLLFATAGGFAQSPKSAPALSDKQWEPLLQAMENEDWTKAAEQSGKYLKELKQEDSEHALARLRYIFMLASAAKVAEGQMSYDELKIALKEFIGKELMTPYIGFGAPCPAFNSICVLTSGNYDLSVTASNAKATYIYMFQYVRLATKPDSIPKKNAGTIIGTLETIQFNPNQSNIWIMRVFMEKATLVIGE
jgi:hypothetical protein